MSQEDKLMMQLHKEVKNATKKLGIFTLIFLVLFVIIVFCIINITKLIVFYFSQRATLRESFKATSNNPNNPKDDHEVYQNLDDMLNAENNDEYNRYTSQINKSISEYKTYNEKLRKYYKENKPGEKPGDVIDKSVLQREHDNY